MLRQLGLRGSDRRFEVRQVDVIEHRSMYDRSRRRGITRGTGYLAAGDQDIVMRRGDGVVA